MASQAARDSACREIDDNSESLNALSQSIWEKPELNFEEVHAHQVLTDYLQKHGFEVERKYIRDTGFRAVFNKGDDGPHIAFLCEYDALPEIGHACGHNLIAEVGVAAGLGVKAALLESGLEGKVTVFGTPAEEGGGGKIEFIDAGVFDDVDVAMMAHPAPFTLTHPLCLSISRLWIKYHGKAAHAAGFPWEGVNALDAAVLCYQNLSCLRQQMKPNWRLHGVIVNGGAKPNIIPELTELDYYLRAPTVGELDVLTEKVIKAVEAAGVATGCKVEHSFVGPSYHNLITNSTLAAAFEKHLKSLGMQFTPDTGQALGSTDMGNVSYVVPSLHPGFSIGSAVNHTREFTQVSGSREAQGSTLKVGKALALVALDVLESSDLLVQVKEDFKLDIKKNTSTTN